MFDRLEDLLIRFEELMSELSAPDVANNPERFKKLMKEQSDLTPIVNAYKEYKQCKQNIEDSLVMLEEESDEEMRELAKEELNDAKARVEELENELKNMGFVRAHLSFLVNMKYITKISSYVMTLTTGKKIPVPKARYAQVKREYMLYKGEE